MTPLVAMGTHGRAGDAAPQVGLRSDVMIGLLFGNRSSGGTRATINAFRSPESRSILVASVGIAVAAVALWAGGAAVLSLLNAWIVVLLTAALGVAVYVRGRKVRQRQEWIDAGHCAQCGYDLHGVPARVCPECGRDGALDEPVWRRLQREHEAKFGRDTAALTGGVELDDAAVRRLLAKAQTFDR